MEVDVSPIQLAAVLGAVVLVASMLSVELGITVALIELTLGVVVLPRLAPPFFRRYGDRVIEAEIKLVFVALFVLMVLADASNGHAVLPAFILGLAMRRRPLRSRTDGDRRTLVPAAARAGH